ncbi:hypothetical protein BH20ACI1_BH20ACI1_13130 [soil metagenome]
MKQEIRIVIADDHPIMRQGLKQIIEIEPNLKIVGEAGNGYEALAMIEELKPDAANYGGLPAGENYDRYRLQRRRNAPSGA